MELVEEVMFEEGNCMLIASQDQDVSRNSIMKHVHREERSTPQDLFNVAIAPIVNESSSLTQNKYKRWSHDQIIKSSMESCVRSGCFSYKIL